MSLKPEARAEGMRTGFRLSDADSLGSRFGLPGSGHGQPAAGQCTGTTVGDRRYRASAAALMAFIREASGSIRL